MPRTVDVSSFLPRWIARWAILAWLFVAPALHAQQLLLVSSQTTQPYLQSISQLHDALDDEQITLLHRPVSALTEDHIRRAELIITLGVSALDNVLANGNGPPVLAAMIPKQSFEQLVVRYDAAERISSHRLSAIYIEQPYNRQLQLARQLVPGAKKLGILLGPQSLSQRPVLEQEARKQGLQTQLASLSEKDNPLSTIRELVSRSDLLLTLPDEPDFTRNTAKWLLMLSLRKPIPLIGFSKRYVDAGALASVFSSPTSISREVVLWTRRWLDDRSHQLPPPSYPELFELSFNPSIAARLGITLPAEEQLRGQLQLDSSP